MAPRKRAIDFVRPHLLSLKAYEAVDPPEVLAARAGIPESEIVKLDANESPYGPSPLVMNAMPGVPRIHLYPDPAQMAMRTAVARYLEVGVEQVVIGNGSDEIIDLVFRTVLEPNDSVLVCVPTFGMYEFTAQVCGATTVEVERDEAFQIDVDAVLAAINGTTKIITVASPNNPSGNSVPPEMIERLLKADAIVMVDEAYAEFGGTSVVKWVSEHPNLIVLRTLSKWGGLAGLRAGYGVMEPDMADLLLRAKPPYNINQATEHAVLASLDDTATLNQRAASIVEERGRMFAALDALPGVTPLPSDANFILCHVPDGKGRPIYEGLARRGVFVRYYSRASMADYLRISVGTPAQTTRLLEAFAQSLSD
ncbi:MAG: histidinol-phosphate transaminase [Chloroflexi bacterium]|nr:histidinol-phosphate transaminase [Chloroflexota bacterium]